MELSSLIIIGIIIVTLAVGAWKRFEMTSVLLLGNLLIFFVGIFAAPNAVIRDLAFRPLYLETGSDLYTLFTSMFIHASFLHLIGNMIFLFLIGTPLEQRIGKARFTAVYLIAGLGGGLVAAMLRLDTPFVFMLGASGAISGVVGAMLLLYPRDEIPMVLGFLFLPKVPVWLSAVSWFLLSVLLYAFAPNSPVAWEAHLSGFLIGAFVAGAIGRKEVARRKAESQPSDYTDLEPLATTPQLRSALDVIRREEQRDVRRAWLEYFAEHAKCPQCEGEVKYQGNKLICPCGYEINAR